MSAHTSALTTAAASRRWSRPRGAPPSRSPAWPPRGRGGRCGAVVAPARAAPLALAALLAEWRAFADVSTYAGRPVPFFKRAQIAAADLDRMGVAELRDFDGLT